MRSSARQFHNPYPFQLNLQVASIIEKAQPCAQEYRHDVNMEFLSKPCSQALLCSTRGSYYVDIFLTAAVLACRMALSIPSVTKVKVR